MARCVFTLTDAARDMLRDLAAHEGRNMSSELDRIIRANYEARESDLTVARASAALVSSKVTPVQSSCPQITPKPAPAVEDLTLDEILEGIDEAGDEEDL